MPKVTLVKPPEVPEEEKESDPEFDVEEEEISDDASEEEGEQSEESSEEEEIKEPEIEDIVQEKNIESNKKEKKTPDKIDLRRAEIYFDKLVSEKDPKRICDSCDPPIAFSNKSNYVKHVKKFHSKEKELIKFAKAVIPSIVKARCRICKKELWDSVKVRHLKSHFNDQARKEQEVKAQTRELVAESYDLRLDFNDPLETQLDTTLKLIERFMLKTDSAKTYLYYKTHMKKMLETWVENGTISSVYSVWSSNAPDMLPMCHDYIDTIKSDSTKLHGIWAYQWILKFTRMRLGCEPNRSEDQNAIITRKRAHIESYLGETRTLNTTLKNKMKKNPTNASFVADRGTRLDEIREKELFKHYSKSEFRKSMIESSTDWLQNYKSGQPRSSFAYIRNFLTLELMIIGGGNRMDAIRNMTTQEFLEADKNEDGSYMVAVTHHKTGQYDKALVYVTNELHTLISRYYNGVRREQMFVGFYGTVMFPTSKGVVQERLDGSVNLFNGWVQKAGLTKKTFVPNDFRHYFSDWGNRNEDQEIVNKVASAQNHSQEVHLRNYKHNKAVEKKKIAERFILETGIESEQIVQQTTEDEEALQKERNSLKRKHEIAEKKAKKKRYENHGRKKLEPEERRLYLKGFFKVGEVQKKYTVSKTQILAFIHKDPERKEGAKRTADRLNKTVPQLAETISSSIRTYFRNKELANEPTVLSDSEDEYHEEDEETPKDVEEENEECE